MQWQQHVKKVRMGNPGMSFKQALQEASSTYKRTTKEAQKRGSGKTHVKASTLVYDAHPRRDYGNYKYKSGNDEHGAWVSPENVIIAFRGTTTKADVKVDAMLAIGRLKATARYKRDLAFTKKIMSSSRVPVILTGHSLGGSIAITIGKALNLKVFGYNPGAGAIEHVEAKVNKLACAVNKKGKRCKKTKKINIERTIGDPVSILGKAHPNTKHIVPTRINVHSIANWSTGDL